MIRGRDARALAEVAYAGFAAGVQACIDAPVRSEKEMRALFLAATAVAWKISIEAITAGMETYHKAVD